MTDGLRTVAYNADLGLEAFRFGGFDKPFPNHFHDHYVFGFVKHGARKLVCKGVSCQAQAGDLLLFNPGEVHGCVQVGDEPLEYWGINITKESMRCAIAEVANTAKLPMFFSAVVADTEAIELFCSLHCAVMSASQEFDCEQDFLLLIDHLLSHYGDLPHDDAKREVHPTWHQVVEQACMFMQAHYSEHITLDTLCDQVNVGKSTLIRAFIKEKGITPYLYVESIRIERARALLEEGVTLVDTAARTGFADQSHFSHYFKRITGLTPGAYRALFVDDRTAHKHEKDSHKHDEISNKRAMTRDCLARKDYA